MPTRPDSSASSEEISYIDALAMELASETCMRCSGRRGWRTAAMIYEGLEMKYYYCYECRRWSARHFRYRYATAPLDDPEVIGMLLRQLESTRELIEAQLESVSWFRRRISEANGFFQRFLP